MSDNNGKDEWLLWVPRKTKEKLDKKAEKENIDGRAPWAIMARKILADAVQDIDNEDLDKTEEKAEALV